MGSSSDSSLPPMGDIVNNEVPYNDDYFRESFEIIDGGLEKDANLSLATAIPDEEGKYKVVTEPKFLLRETPHASTHNEDDKKKPTEWDIFFDRRFKEFDLKLKARQDHVPWSVTEGTELTSVGVSAGGPKSARKRKATPHDSASTSTTVDNEDDEIYAREFKRLNLELKAKQVQVPSSVTEGNVAVLTMVVSAEGEPVFKSGLEEHVREQTK